MNTLVIRIESGPEAGGLSNVFFLYEKKKKNVNLIYIPLHCTDIEPEVALHITRSRQCNKFYEQREKAALYLFSSYCILHFYKYYCLT